MKFTVSATDGAARAGTLELAHGRVETPVFMPVGTYGAVKAVSPAELAENGTRIVLGNTFHLWLRPGLEVIAAHGGLHRFIGWSGDRKSTRLNSSHLVISYAVFCLK